jgi:hypothetical protein
MRALIVLAALASFSVACSGSADVSVGRNDPVAKSDDPAAGASRDPWAGPTSVCDKNTCRIGSDCTLTVGSCDVTTGFAAFACEYAPETCSDEVLPVCGCDRHSYANACEAARAGVGILAVMPCE